MTSFYALPLRNYCCQVCWQVHAGSRMGARSRVGLPPVGPGGRSGLWSGGLVSGIGSFWGGWVFGSCGNSLLLAENYNRTTTNNTTEAQSAQRLNGGGLNSLRLDDPCGLWASLARQPIDRAACLPLVQCSCFLVRRMWAGRPHSISFSRRASC